MEIIGKEGDTLRIVGADGAVWHYGKLIPNYGQYGPCVVHNNKGVGIQIDYYEVFCDGQIPEVTRPAPDDPIAQREIVNRALSAVEKQGYSTLFYNCEDFVNWAHDGVPYSKQVLGLCGLVLVGLYFGRPRRGQ
jgi:hypothetical protein